MFEQEDLKSKSYFCNEKMLNAEESKMKKALKSIVSVPREHCFSKPISVKM